MLCNLADVLSALHLQLHVAGCTEDPVPLLKSCVGTVVAVKKDHLHPSAKQYLGYPCLGVIPGIADLKDKLHLHKGAARKYVSGAWTICNCKEDLRIDIPKPVEVIEAVKDAAATKVDAMEEVATAVGKVVAAEAGKLAAGAEAAKAGADQIAKGVVKVAAGIVDAKVQGVTAVGNLVGKAVKDGVEAVGDPELLRLPTITLPDLKLPEIKLPEIKLPEVKFPTPKDVVEGVVDLKKKELAVVGAVAAGAAAAKLKVLEGVKTAAEGAAKAGLKVAGSVAVEKAKAVQKGLEAIDLGFEIPDLGEMVENMTGMMEELGEQINQVKRRPGGG
jgi:X-X-X-Leu-X-X-Gly heptad repeat protein